MYKNLLEELKAGRPCVLVTILSSSGSTPRKAGAQMWVSAEKSGGTIGGGNLEFTAEKTARSLLAGDKDAEIKDYNLGDSAGPDSVVDLGMVCGGAARVLYMRLSAQDIPIIETISEAQSGFLVIDLSDAARPVLSYAEHGDYGRTAKLSESDGRTRFTLPVGRRGKVYVFGGGHVSKDTVALLSALDFACVVIDDHAEFANRERFPTAEDVIVTPFETVGELLTISPDDYVIIMTRGHKADYIVERQMLKKKPYYLGMIGSRKKIASVNARLLADGFTNAELAAVNAPIGLAIQAQTPMEIAVSIAGELILKRAEYK